MPSPKARTAAKKVKPENLSELVSPTLPPILQQEPDPGSLIVTERDGTQHTLTPCLSAEGGAKMAWIGATSERIAVRLEELQALDVDATTDHVISTVLSLQSRLGRLSEEMMLAIVPDYPPGLYGRLPTGEANRMVAQAIALAVHGDE